MNQIPQKEVMEIPVSGEYVTILCSHIFVKSRPGIPRPFNKRYPIWLISGNNSTNQSGEDTLDINSFLCYPICDIGENINENLYEKIVIISQTPNFYATPNTEFPVLITSKIESKRINNIPLDYMDIINGEILHQVKYEYDIQIKIFSWNLDGTKAAKVKYSWVCIAGAALRPSTVY